MSAKICDVPLILEFPKKPYVTLGYRTKAESVTEYELKSLVISLLITSTIPQEGKTTTCINLGISLAQQGHKTIILDCDFRRPMLHRYLSQYISGNTNGLSDVLVGRLKLKDAVVEGTAENLNFITSGTIPSNPAAFSSAGQKPPPCESPIKPVTGDFAVAVTRDWPEKAAPVTTPTINDSVFSGPSGSALGGVCSRR